MSVLRTEDGKELILTCRCGCDDGIHFKIDKDFEDYMYMTYTNGNFYRDQDNGFFRTLGSYEKFLQSYSIKITIMQKQYFLKKILKSLENILIVLLYIKKTPLTLWTISRVIGIDQDQ